MCFAYTDVSFSTRKKPKENRLTRRNSRDPDTPRSMVTLLKEKMGKRLFIKTVTQTIIQTAGVTFQQFSPTIY